jgi:hypothetical protein
MAWSSFLMGNKKGRPARAARAIRCSEFQAAQCMVKRWRGSPRWRMSMLVVVWGNML